MITKMRFHASLESWTVPINPARSQLVFSKALWSAGVIFAIFAVCGAGCGGAPSADYGKLGLVQIAGQVTLDGQPLNNASIRFVDTDGTYCVGTTDALGHYTMMLDSRKSGVIPGQKTVIISSQVSPSESAGAADDDPDAKPKSPETVPECYNKNSKLAIAVTTSDSAMDFDLKKDCSTTSYR